jgi:hypothetical protein
MQSAGTKAVSGRSIAVVIDALAAHGIEIDESARGPCPRGMRSRALRLLEPLRGIIDYDNG